jgi:hypothetical protein
VEELESQLQLSMKYILIFLALTQGLLLDKLYAVEGIDEQGLKLKIANLLEYPPGQLFIEDVTSQSIAQNARSQRPVAIEAKAVFKIKSNVGVFAPMTIAISSLGIPMLEEIEQAVKMQEGKSNANTIGKQLPRKVYLRNGGYAYLAPMVGPGGSQNLVLARIPSMSMDVAISITTARSDMTSLKGNASSETEAYYRLITQGGDHLADRLIECVEATIDTVRLLSSPSVQQTPVRPIPPSTSSIVSSNNSTPSLESSDPRPSPAVESEYSKSSQWPWITGAILLLAVLGGVLVKFRRK